MLDQAFCKNVAAFQGFSRRLPSVTSAGSGKSSWPYAPSIDTLPLECFSVAGVIPWKKPDNCSCLDQGVTLEETPGVQLFPPIELKLKDVAGLSIGEASGFSKKRGSGETEAVPLGPNLGQAPSHLTHDVGPSPWILCPRDIMEEFTDRMVILPMSESHRTGSRLKRSGLVKSRSAVYPLSSGALHTTAM